MTPEMKQVMAAIRRHRRFVVSTHINPEGDALGSALALASLIRRLGKRAAVATHGGVPKAFAFLPLVAPASGRVPPGLRPEVAMTVDVPVLERLGSMIPVFNGAGFRAVIDHHVSNRRFGDVNWVDPKAAAVGEMIYRLYRAFKVRPTREEALCMYASIVTDTGSFRYMSTTPEVLRIAADLVERGVSPLQVSQELYECHSVSDLKFLGKVLATLRQLHNGKIVWVEVTASMVRAGRPGPEIMDELVNYPRAVRTAEAAFILREQPSKKQVRVSFRSKGRIDVNAIARTFGGGGHMAASGCTIEGTLDQARARVVREVERALRGLK
ncbi:MAG: bifunctional oligoribonuclease/PAP phosphatase NrnA [Candidatus Omnitrophica bacterium]|nr:bifunctional oligoribonuclease/PAP phosphatase NrnA [Candidatus Omnitrophota bacterium]